MSGRQQIYIISVRMKNRGKENSQSVSNQWVASTYRVEADQKEVIIKGLRGDKETLKKNENQYHRLQDTYRALQQKFKMLSDEKGNDDREFKMRHEAAVRNIGQLKNEIDALRAELRDKKLEATDLEGDQTVLKQSMDEKTIELENFRNDYKSCIADSEELGVQKEGLNNASTKLKQIICQGQQEGRFLQEDNDNVSQRLAELDRYHQQLIIQEKILRQKIQGYENQNNDLDTTINEVTENLADIQLGIKKAQEELIDLQKAMTELGLLNQKYKTENGHVQKNIQNEIIKNNNHLKNLKNGEYTQKVRLGQTEEADREVKALKEENQSLNQVNTKLAEDLEACRIHLQNLGLINCKLVQHLESFSSEDDQIRDLIHRKARVQMAGNRVNEVSGSKTPYLQTRTSSRNDYF